MEHFGNDPRPHNLQVPSSNPGDFTHLSEYRQTVYAVFQYQECNSNVVSLRFHENAQ